MKKLLLSILSIASLTAFPQWQTTSIFSTGDDCYSAFGKAFISDGGSSSLDVSTDDGATWSPSNIGVPSSGLSFGDINSGTVYAYRNTSIYSSTTGNNWTAMNTSAINASEVIKDIAVIGTNSVFACTNPISGNGIKIYQLSGTTWNFKANVPTATAPLSLCMKNMNSELWIGTTSTLSIKSTNGGSTWAACNGTLTSANWWDKYVLCLGATSTTLFMGTYGGRLVKSMDGGGTWSVGINISTGSTISMSDVYVMSATNILVACDSGFYYSNNGGSSFQKDNTGLSAANKYLTKITATSNYIIASTGNGVIVRRPLNQIFSGIKEFNPLVIESKVYPNPSNDFTTIEASDLMFDKNCEVKITDVLGREILVSEMKNGKTQINLSSFAKGIYTYSVYNNNTVVSKGKLVVN